MDELFNGKEIRANDRSSGVKIFIQSTKLESKERKMATISLWVWYWDQACQKGEEQSGKMMHLVE